MTKELGHPLLASRIFARAVTSPFVSLGVHPLRGISEPEELFYPAGTNSEAVNIVEPHNLSRASYVQK